MKKYFHKEENEKELLRTRSVPDNCLSQNFQWPRYEQETAKRKKKILRITEDDRQYCGTPTIISKFTYFLSINSTLHQWYQICHGVKFYDKKIQHGGRKIKYIFVILEYYANYNQ